MDILKAKRRDGYVRAVGVSGKPLKSEAGVRVTSGNNRDRTIRTTTSPVMEYDNQETSAQNNRMELQQRYNTESQKLAQYQRQKKDIISSGNQSKIDAMDDNSPNALNNKIMSAQKLVNSLMQNIQGNQQVPTQGNLVRKPVPPSTTPTKAPTTPPKAPTKRRAIPAKTSKQRAYEDFRLSSVTNKLRNKPKEELSEGVKRVLNPKLNERQRQRGPPPKTYTNKELQERHGKKESPTDEVNRRIAEERRKLEQTAESNRRKRESSP